MQATNSDIRYVEPVLKRLAHKFAGIGLAIAVVLHFTFVGAYWTAEYFSRAYDEKIDIPIPGPIFILPAPPPIGQHPLGPISVIDSKPDVGTPVLVPDATVSADKTIPTQGDLDRVDAAINGCVDGGEGASGSIKVPDSIVAPPDSFVPVERFPQVVKSVLPDYPDLARRIGIEGRVIVKLWVDKDGMPHQSSVLKSSEEILNKAAIDAAMGYRFTPAIMNKGPVSVWITIPFVFKLKQGL